MWLKNIYSRTEETEKNGGQEDAIDYEEEEQHKRDDGASGEEDDSAGGREDGPANREDNAANREDASDQEECPLDDDQVNEKIEDIIKNMSSDEEEEGEVVEDEIPYDRIETNNELNKEVILLNFYADMSSHRLSSLMSIFGKVRNSFIDDNEGVHVIFNSLKSSKRAKELLDNVKIKNRRIQVVYGTYEERRDDARMGGAAGPGEDPSDTGQMRGTLNDASSTSYHDKLGNPKNGKTPVKLYKNRKYYLNTAPTHVQNGQLNNYTYNNQVKGMVPHGKTNTYFVPPSSSANMINEFVPPSDMTFSQQDNAPMNNNLHNHLHNNLHNRTRGPMPNNKHHPDQAPLHDMPNFNNVVNYVQPPPPPPPTSRTLYNQSFSESGRGSGQMEPYPHYTHPNNPHHTSSHLGNEGNVNRMPNNQLLSPHVKRKNITENFPNTYISSVYKKNSFDSPPGNTPYVSYPNQPPTSSRNMHMKGVPPPPHHIGNSTHGETSMINVVGGNHPPPPIIPRSREMPTSTTGPLYNNSFNKSHPNNEQYHGGNHPNGEEYPMAHGLYNNYEEYATTHGLYNNYEEYAPHSAHTMKPSKLVKYGKTGKHNKHQNLVLTSEREANHYEEPVEYTPFNEDNPFGISEENQMVDNPTWNDRKIKQVLKWDQDASVEKNHLDFVESFGCTKVYNRYLLVTNMPDHLDNENKVKEHINELFSSEKMRCFCVEVSLFVCMEVDEERFFKNAIQGEHDAPNEEANPEEAPIKGEEINPDDAAVKGEEANPEEEPLKGEEVAPIKGEEDAPNEEAGEQPKRGGKRKGAKKAVAPKPRKKRGKAKNKADEAEQAEEVEQVEQVEKADEAEKTEQTEKTEKTEQTEQTQQVVKAKQTDEAGAASGKRYAHLTFRTIRNCVEAKKVLEKNNFKVTFSCPSKANVCLWVGNLLRNYFINTANILKSMFTHFGSVKSVKYVFEKNCLFIQYASVADAIKARNHMYGLQVSNNTMLNLDFSSLVEEGDGKQHKVSFTRKRLLDALAYDNGKMKQRLESTMKKRNTGFIDSKVMHLLRKEGNHDGNIAEVRLKRHATDKGDDYNVKRRPNMYGRNRSPSTSMYRRKYRSSARDFYPNSNTAYDKTRDAGGGYSKCDKREARRSSKRKGTIAADDYSNHRHDHHDRHHHHDDHHHRRHKRRRSKSSKSMDGADGPGYNSRGEEEAGSTNRHHAQQNTDSDFNSLDGIELNDYNEIQKTVSFYVNQKYKCDFISNFYDGNPELKIYPKLNVETKSDVQNLMNIRNSCTDYSIWQLGPTVKQKKKFLHICEHFSKKKNIPVIIDNNLTIFIVPMKEDYLKDLGIDNPDFMYAFVLQTKKN
ncbi:hypothetical protein AK88_02451 [Plasmodium fragile]|uniref:RRM domain-containing protein n=1 Tax=Plasmodium fragile TaxID=5857 RepID=A0A0D9QM25_PLAFR|nr:uncharacterized protein AK88_02451 [Plasmodium fragile]KJP87847.1 hypothetical protein AK88_02451 [Plasmodium fragile]